MNTVLPPLFRARVEVAAGVVATLTLLAAMNSSAQTYAPPAAGDFGGVGSFAVFVDSFIFVFAHTDLQANFSATLTNAIGTSPSQFWRILAP